MTESPWANPSSRHIPPPANWGFYLLINIGLAVAVGIVVELLATATQFRVPDIAVNLGVLFATVMLAGGRWLKTNGGTWTREDRKRLALAYLMVNTVLTLIVIGLGFVAVQAGYGDKLGISPAMLSEGATFIALALAIAIPLALAINYGLTRLVLGRFVNSQARNDPSEEFR